MSNWQDIAAILLAVAALAYLVRAAWRTLGGGSAKCGSGCSKCETPVVEITPRDGRNPSPSGRG